LGRRRTLASNKQKQECVYYNGNIYKALLGRLASREDEGEEREREERTCLLPQSVQKCRIWGSGFVDMS